MEFNNKVFVRDIRIVILMSLPLILGIMCMMMFKSILMLIVFDLIALIYPDIIYVRIKVKDGESQEDIYKKICRKNRLKVKENESPAELYSRLKKKGRIDTVIFFFIGTPVLSLGLNKIVDIVDLITS